MSFQHNCFFKRESTNNFINHDLTIQGLDINDKLNIYIYIYIFLKICTFKNIVHRYNNAKETLKRVMIRRFTRATTYYKYHHVS
jgi:hypothetical protein